MGEQVPSDLSERIRTSPVSGRYEGEMTAPRPGRYLLDLRVDIDPRYPNSPVTDRVSGDIYQVTSVAPPGRPPVVSRVYRESWVVDAPRVRWSRNQVEITGGVRFYGGRRSPASLAVRIPWGSPDSAGPAEVTLSGAAGGKPSTYACKWRSDCFRDMALEVEVCRSAAAIPILPVYETGSHPCRPADLPPRTLSIQEAYREAGVDVSLSSEYSIIDDSVPEFEDWSPAELHDAMETYFSRFAGPWPRWAMWGLLAGAFEEPAVGGIMFDAAAGFGGAGEPPDRQGFAVFRRHEWFRGLADGRPAGPERAWAMRQLLYTWVHEAGHAFNFLHSWDKGRPDALSWMNYPHRVPAFWDSFQMRFDDEELVHLRHGDRRSVIMGGEPWSSGGHLDAGPEEHLEAPQVAPPASWSGGDSPLELAVRSRGYFDFMEPVTIELRIRNVLGDLPLELDTRLRPEYGGVVVYIRRPDGRTVHYRPPVCKLGTPLVRTLAPRPGPGTAEGEDRFSEEVFLGYGKHGFYFDEPGEYLVRAVYRGNGDFLIPSNVHRVRIGSPASREEDRLAQDFFTPQVGMSLYLNGSRSPFLARGMGLLESLALSDPYRDTVLGAKLAGVLANSVARPFFRVQESRLTRTQVAEPERALAVTRPALAVYRREKAKSLNLAYHRLVRDRAACMIALGQRPEARTELAALREDLAGRGVNESVLREIRAYEETI